MREILFIRMVLCIFSRKTNGMQLNMAHKTQHHPPLIHRLRYFFNSTQQ